MMLEGVPHRKGLIIATIGVILNISVLFSIVLFCIIYEKLQPVSVALPEWFSILRTVALVCLLLAAVFLSFVTAFIIAIFMSK